MEYRECTKCGIEKPMTSEYYHVRRNTKRGFVSQCKECRSIKKEVVLGPNKECSRCHIEKPRTTEYFGVTKANRDGLAGQCKECRTEIAKEYYEENREEILKKSNEYHYNNKEERRLAGQRHYKENREYYNDYSKQYHIENSKELNRKGREWYQENKEHHAKYMKWHHQNNKDMYRNIRQRRRARMADLPYDLTIEEWQESLEFFGNRCAYCGVHQDELDEILNQEHVIPVVNGGGYTKDNIIPSCGSCNSSKGVSEFRDWYKMVDENDMVKHNNVVYWISSYE